MPENDSEKNDHQNRTWREFLSESELLQLLNWTLRTKGGESKNRISPATLAFLRKAKGLPFFQVTRRCRVYRADEFHRWLELQREGGSGPGTKMS